MKDSDIQFRILGNEVGRAIVVSERSATKLESNTLAMVTAAMAHKDEEGNPDPILPTYFDAKSDSHRKGALRELQFALAHARFSAADRNLYLTGDPNQAPAFSVPFMWDEADPKPAKVAKELGLSAERNKISSGVSARVKAYQTVLSNAMRSSGYDPETGEEMSEAEKKAGKTGGKGAESGKTDFGNATLKKLNEVITRLENDEKWLDVSSKRRGNALTSLNNAKKSLQEVIEAEAEQRAKDSAADADK